MPNIFSTKDFNVVDHYENSMKAAAKSCDILCKKVPNEYKENFKKMRSFLYKFVDDLDEVSLEKFASFHTIYEEMMGYLRDYVKNNKDKTGTMSEAEKSDYSVIAENLEVLEGNQQHIDSLQRGLHQIREYHNNLFEQSDEQKMQDLFDKFGLFGHQPTIYECLTMSPENTDIETLIDRMLWLKKCQIDAGAAGKTPDFDNSFYGYAIRRLEAHIFVMPVDKQVELNICMNRYVIALRDTAYKKLMKLRDAFPKDKAWHDPEMEIFVSEKMLNESEDEQILEVKHDIDVKFKNNYKEHGLAALQYMKNNPEFDKMLKETTKEQFTILQFSNTDVGHAVSGAEGLFYSVNNTGRGQVIRKEIQDIENVIKMMDARPSSIIGGISESGEQGIKKRFRESENEERRELGRQHDEDVKRKGLEEYGKIRENKFSKYLLDMAEPYVNIFTDTRKATNSFTELRDSLNAVFSVEMPLTNDQEKLVKICSDIKSALTKIDAYQNSHKFLRFSEQGRQRKAWNAALKAGMEKTNRYVLHKLGKIRTNEAIYEMKNCLTATNNPNSQRRPAEREADLKKIYAKLVFSNMVVNSKNAALPGTGEEEKQLQNFQKSEALNAAFGKHGIEDFQRLVDDPSSQNIKAEIEKVKNAHKVLKDRSIKQIKSKTEPVRQL